jgi:hypothetical protein
MIAVVTSSLRPPAGGRRLPRHTPVALSPLIGGTMHIVTPKSLGCRPQQQLPAGGNRRSTTSTNARHIPPARCRPVKSP